MVFSLIFFGLNCCLGRLFILEIEIYYIIIGQFYFPRDLPVKKQSSGVVQHSNSVFLSYVTKRSEGKEKPVWPLTVNTLRNSIAGNKTINCDDDTRIHILFKGRAMEKEPKLIKSHGKQICKLLYLKALLRSSHMLRVRAFSDTWTDVRRMLILNPIFVHSLYLGSQKPEDKK